MIDDILPRAAAAAAAALLILGAGPAVAQQAAAPPGDADFVYVNSQEILRQAPGASEAQQTWTRELDEYRSEVQALATEIDSLQQALDARRESLDGQEIERREERIRQKEEELARRARELEQRAAQRREELLGPILQDVGTVIEEIRAEKGYDMVFDIASSGLRAGAPRLDITDLVLERLRQRRSDGNGSTGGAGSGGSRH